METIILGGGCFWCLEAIFTQINGVIKVASGYAGGNKSNPTYQEVCSEITGHAEVVQVEFNSAQVSNHELLNLFWSIHDPTTLNAQGGDRGTQYRSIVMTETDEQRETAERVIRELMAVFSGSGHLRRVASTPDALASVAQALDDPENQAGDQHRHQHNGESDA